jgi:FkbM family methyltransferase
MIKLLRRVLNYYPFMTPRASLLSRLPAVPANAGPFRARHGMISSYYPGHDFISASLYWFGDFDPWVDRTLRRLVERGESAFDIGANIGVTSLVLANAAGPSGKIVAFEPHPRNARYLRDNLSANKLSGAEIVELALSDVAGSFHLAEPPGQPGMARLVEAAVPGSIEVKTARLDDWLRSHPDIGNIAVCKIDVEGHELGVLRGMRDTLASGRIAAIVFERHLPNHAPDDVVMQLLEKSGYQLYRIEKSPLTVSYVPLWAAPRARMTSDYVAVHVRTDAGRKLGLPCGT